MSQGSLSSGLLSAKIQTAANIATIIVASLLSAVLIKTYFLPASWPHKTPALLAQANVTDATAVGTKLAERLPGIDWKRNRRTVLLVLSTHCHFCTESAPFFRQLSEKAGNSVKLIGALPETPAEAGIYLKREGVRLNEIKQVSLGKLGVRGTPTMLLLDDHGTVTASWIGKLDPSDQDQALKSILTIHNNSTTISTNGSL